MFKHKFTLPLYAILLIAFSFALAQVQEDTATQAPAERPHLDVPYVPTPPEVVAQMLKMANVSKQDTVYDPKKTSASVIAP